jgi:hypothetical protein
MGQEVTGWVEEEETLLRAGIAGSGVYADGAKPSRRSKKRVAAASKKGESGRLLCGVGLVLEAWRPKGLALALNKIAGTHEAVRVDTV